MAATCDRDFVPDLLQEISLMLDIMLSPEKIGVDDNADLAALVRTIADYPKPGVMFRDVSTLLLDGPGFRSAIDRLADSFDPDKVDKIAGIEARGFIIASALAYKLGKGVVMLRKSGKLPGEAVGIDYALEYGTDRIEMHLKSPSPVFAVIEKSSNETFSLLRLPRIQAIPLSWRKLDRISPKCQLLSDKKKKFLRKIYLKICVIIRSPCI